MPLMSEILSGNPRLEQAASGGPSVKRQPPADDPSAVRAIQRALVKLGYSLPRSYPQGPAGEPDGIFGDETFNAVYAYQKREFAGMPGEWDGRVGQKTLARMDAQLPRPAPPEVKIIPGKRLVTASKCEAKTPHVAVAALRPSFAPRPPLGNIRRV